MPLTSDFPFQKYFVSPNDWPASQSDNQVTELSISERFDYQRVGIRLVSLPPGARTSTPHAESLEEEFVFVVSGRPDAWIDGFIYPLKENVAVGFAAGTGIAHSFINNTPETIQLLVLGERTKKENRCAFPVDPDVHAASDIRWDDAPVRPLGPHRGHAGAVQKHELGSEWPNFILDCETAERNQGWHYPGDSETFSHYVRIGPKLGLKVLGLGFEVLLPGHRSAFPHAHFLEEEFVFVIKGEATIWMNGFTRAAAAGTAVAFVPNTNIAHSVLNDGSEPVIYFVAGEATDPGGADRIIYPLHPFRNEQCRRLKVLWQDRPLAPMGNHIGRPGHWPKGHLQLRHASSPDESLLLALFQSSPTYFARVDGCEPTLQSVRQAMADGPKVRVESYLKEFLIIELDDQPIGVVDLHFNHPEPGICYLGLLLLTEASFQKGLGRRSFALVEHYAKVSLAVGKIRLGVSDDNEVSPFWRKMGFAANGHQYTWQGEKKLTKVIEYEKTLS